MANKIQNWQIDIDDLLESLPDGGSSGGGSSGGGSSGGETIKKSFSSAHNGYFETDSEIPIGGAFFAIKANISLLTGPSKKRSMIEYEAQCWADESNVEIYGDSKSLFPESPDLSSLDVSLGIVEGNIRIWVSCYALVNYDYTANINIVEL